MTNKLNNKELSKVNGGTNIPNSIHTALIDLNFYLSNTCMTFITEPLKLPYEKAINYLNLSLDAVKNADEASFKSNLKELLKELKALISMSCELNGILHGLVTYLENECNKYI